MRNKHLNTDVNGAIVIFMVAPDGLINYFVEGRDGDIPFFMKVLRCIHIIEKNRFRFRGSAQ